MMGILSLVAPFAIMCALMYFLLILPEKKRNKSYKSMIDGLAKNDEIMTKGGIIGKIIIIEDDYIVMETSAERTKIKLSKNGISAKL